MKPIEDPLALSRYRPQFSAHVPMTRAQQACALLACVAILLCAFWRPWETVRAFVLLSTLFYLLFSLYKIALVRLSANANAELRISPAELAALQPDELPVYSILVPLYKEPESAARLVAGLERMDYPADKMDVILLLEEDDLETRAVVQSLPLRPGFRTCIAPPSFPRTKPKACNLGLCLARGKYLVIYDAEDRPEPDQLKKAVAAFNRAGPDTACLQSRLNFYNPRQNLLTRWFAAEYSAWFDMALPGLSALNAMIPLGGTSNHFVLDRLIELMGWDAYNVTEDCDLGIRIYRAGWRTRMLETTTWEEACGNLHYWIRQRTRWLKGYIQTYLVHMRNPLQLLREVGLGNFLHFQLLVGGIVFSCLINPVFWFMALLWFLFRTDALTYLFPGYVFVMGAVCLFVGNFTFAYLCAIGCYRRGYHDLVPHAVLSPFYWILMSYSGWRAFFQFFSKPFHWEKTHHSGTGSTPN